jgi:hypothetical protein
LAGCDFVFRIDHIDPQPEGANSNNAYGCSCTCTYADTGVATRSYQVCVPAAYNANLDGGVAPSQSQLAADCQGRVQTQVKRMTDDCTSPDPVCTCMVASPQADFFYDKACDGVCAPVPLTTGCANWDFRTGLKTANCAQNKDCVDPGSVCLTPRSDPPVPVPAPLAAGFLGQATLCRLTELSDAILTVDGDDHTSPLTGFVELSPAPAGTCATGQTCLAMTYRVDTTQPFDFDALLGLESIRIQNITALGASTTFALDSAGGAELGADNTQTSGRGTETDSTPVTSSTERVAMFGTNAEPVTVSFDGSAAVIDGALLGAALGSDDGDPVQATAHIVCHVENTPPKASFGGDQTIECTSTAGAWVTLTSSSQDAEGNLASYAWSSGSRAGPSLGTGPSISFQQALGSQTVFLKAIDAEMQMDVASATIRVADTTGPSIACNAPATITPSTTPYQFTATASDTCDATPTAATVLDYTCSYLNSKGKEVARDQCSVMFSGGTFVILDSGGVNNIFHWRVRSADDTGNTTVTTCSTMVVRKK